MNRDIISYWIIMTIVIYITVLNRTFSGYYNDRQATAKNAN